MPAITVFCALQVVSVSAVMLAVVFAVEEQSVCRHALCGPGVFQRGDFRRPPVRDWRYEPLVDLAAERPGPDWRRHFRVPPRFSTPWPVALLMIVAALVASWLILERRVRGVEVVA